MAAAHDLMPVDQHDIQFRQAASRAGNALECIHHEHEETFYVVSGTPTFTCGTDTIIADLGTLAVAPIGVPHTFGNPGDVPAIMLCTVTPDLYIDYFRELDALTPGPTGLDSRAVAEVMARYATEIFKPAP